MASPGSRALQIVADDEGHNGTGGAKSTTGNITINVLSGGRFSFNTATYGVNESGGTATITVLRAGGTAAQQPLTMQRPMVRPHLERAALPEWITFPLRDRSPGTTVTPA